MGGGGDFQEHWGAVLKELGAVVVKRLFTAHERYQYFVILFL